MEKSITCILANTIHYDDCGNCRHWHVWDKDKQKYNCLLGDCDKIQKGTVFECEGKSYTYDGYSFEDENYNDAFTCFEARQGEKYNNEIMA